MNFKVLFIFLFFSFEEVFGQSNFDDFINDYWVDEPLSNLEEVIVDIHSLYENPISINDGNLQALLILPFVSKSDIFEIKKYIEKNGNLKTINEFLLIRGFSREKLKLLMNFIIIKPQSEDLFISSGSLQKGRITSISRFQRNFGGKLSGKFKGDNWKQYFKLSYNLENKIKIGLVAETDAGEKISFNKSANGFDYYSAHLQINYSNSLRQINIGDFSLSWGQGLVASSSAFNCKSSNTVEYGFGAPPLRKYSSTNENLFFRGIAFRYKFTDNIELIPVFSLNSIDARICSDGVISFVNTGLHRNESELAVKDKVLETVYGFRTVYNNTNYQIGLNYLDYSFSDSVLMSKYSWKSEEFIGNHNFNSSIDYRISLANFFLFGESAISKNKSMSHIIGASIVTDNDIQLTVLARNYSSSYQSKYSRGFGETHNTRNEKGLYLGVEYMPINKIKINAYFDYFSFPKEGYRMKNPGDGEEYLLNICYEYSNDINLFFRYKYERKPHDLKIGVITSTKDVNRNIYRMSLKYNINKRFSICSRIEYNTYKHGEKSETGIMGYCDFKYSSLSDILKLQSRISFFNSDSYNTRMYEYENDVLYAFSFPSYYYEGARGYLNTSCKLNQFFTLYVKIGYTYWRVKRDRQDVKFQLRIKI